MRIWIISQFTESIDSNTSNRYTYIFNSLKNRDYDVKFITSDFNHVTKTRKKQEHKDFIKIKEPGYKNNVSIGRIYSHFIYARNAYKYLKEVINENDIVLIALPSNYLGYLLTRYKYKKKLKFKIIVDVHDMWPESLIALLPKAIRKVGSGFWWLWKKLRIVAVKGCDYLLAESVEYELMNNLYLREGVKSNAILLGADVSSINKIPKVIKNKENGEFIVVFAGNLGVNYDIDNTLKMLRKYHKELSDQNIVFYFFGNGEKEKEIIACANNFPEIVKHLARVPYNEYIGILKGFDLGLNSFQKDSAVKYSYKSVDYLVANLPVLNNLTGEFARDIEKYNIGINYVAGDIESMYDKLIEFKESYNKDKYKKNIEQYIDLKLDRDKIYKPLFDFIEMHINNN